MTALTNPAILTVGETAKRFAVAPWMVRRIFERGLLPPAFRVGCYRVIAETDLPLVEDALRQVGYLPPVAEDAHA